MATNIFLQLFFICHTLQSPNNQFPARFQAMDHTGLGRMMYEIPASDGSTCRAMAASLRAALAMEFDSVLGVHVRRMSREEFRRSVDANWNWLDGKSLIGV